MFYSTAAPANDFPEILDLKITLDMYVYYRTIIIKRF
jgi:hypothetical protein